MNRIPIPAIPEPIPDSLKSFTAGAKVFSSSCSDAARVYFIDGTPGLFLKSAPKGQLQREAQMTWYFHKKGFSPRVLCYVSDQRDWLLTQRIPGEDCLQAEYLANPLRLCDTIAGALRQLHSSDPAECQLHSLQARDPSLFTADRYNSSLFADHPLFSSAAEAEASAREGIALLKYDTLIHGDYCLPNIILDNWRFSGLVDVGQGGLGDRHTDLFWGIWSLWFNLKTGQYTHRFLDAYGREDVEPGLLRMIAAIESFE